MSDQNTPPSTGRFHTRRSGPATHYVGLFEASPSATASMSGQGEHQQGSTTPLGPPPSPPSPARGQATAHQSLQSDTPTPTPQGTTATAIPLGSSPHLAATPQPSAATADSQIAQLCKLLEAQARFTAEREARREAEIRELHRQQARREEEFRRREGERDAWQRKMFADLAANVAVSQQHTSTFLSPAMEGPSAPTRRDDVGLTAPEFGAPRGQSRPPGYEDVAATNPHNPVSALSRDRYVSNQDQPRAPAARGEEGGARYSAGLNHDGQSSVLELASPEHNPSQRYEEWSRQMPGHTHGFSHPLPQSAEYIGQHHTGMAPREPLADRPLPAIPGGNASQWPAAGASHAQVPSPLNPQMTGYGAQHHTGSAAREPMTGRPQAEAPAQAGWTSGAGDQVASAQAPGGGELAPDYANLLAQAVAATAAQATQTRRGRFARPDSAVPKFSGFDDKYGVRSYTRRTDRFLGVDGGYRYPDYEVTDRLTVAFTGHALEWYNSLPSQTIRETQTWEQWKKVLHDYFGSAHDTFERQKAAQERVFDGSEDVRVYLVDKITMWQDAYQNATPEDVGNAVVRGLPPRFAASLHYNSSVDNLASLQREVHQRAVLLQSMGWQMQDPYCPAAWKAKHRQQQAGAAQPGQPGNQEATPPYPCRTCGQMHFHSQCPERMRLGLNDRREPGAPPATGSQQHPGRWDRWQWSLATASAPTGCDACGGSQQQRGSLSSCQRGDARGHQRIVQEDGVLLRLNGGSPR